MTERAPERASTRAGGRAPEHPSTPAVLGTRRLQAEQPSRRAAERASTRASTLLGVRRSGEPVLGSIASWLVLGASFGLSAATWVALARLAGYDGTITLFGRALMPLPWLMPAAVDGYVVVALVLWMAPVPARVARFARANTYAAASIGVAAQSAYHCAVAWTGSHETWRAVLAAVVGALPPASAALSVHMRALIRRESGMAERASTEQAEHWAAEQPSILPSIEHPSEQVEQVSGTVRSITSARHHPSTRASEHPSTPPPSTTVTANMERLRAEHPSTVPSGRVIAQLLGCSPSTGDGYRRRLLAERTEQGA